MFSCDQCEFEDASARILRIHHKLLHEGIKCENLAEYQSAANEGGELPNDNGHHDDGGDGVMKV